MQCKISCSFGEVVDKVTILKIKKSKATDKNVLSNILKELTTIQKENSEVNNRDELFDELSKINIELWDFEDLIREKSKKKEFDTEYINYAELIHKTNDKRYLIKKQINEKYKSNLKEEKIYKHEKIVIDPYDIQKLEMGKYLYSKGKYYESIKYIEKIMNKYKDYSTYDYFFIDLLFSYANICKIFNKPNAYNYKIHECMLNIDEIDVSDAQKNFCKTIYPMICFEQKLYKSCYKYLNYINYITGPNISYNNMSFFKTGDVNKTLLIYEGGGLGDKIMLSRFVPKLCNKYKSNKISFIVDDKLFWFFQEVFKNFTNLYLISDKQLGLVGHYNYHCNLLSLIKYFNITYKTLYTSPIYKEIRVDISKKCREIISSFKKNTYILNWKGNPINLHAKHNRMMNLVNAIPLFNLKNIHWIVVMKDVTSQEKKLLKKYNVKYYGNIIDKEKGFYDTISILRNVSGVVSTDTSLPHMSLSLGIKTYVLLTLGCEWRWGKKKITNWYPKAILLRQKELSSWKEPINQLKNILVDL